MADENGSQDEPKKKGGMLKWIIILVLVLGIGAAAFLFKDKIMEMAGMGEASEDEPVAEEVADMKPAPGFKGQIGEVDAFVANLNDPLGKRYIKIGFKVELITEQALLEFTEADIKVKNMLLILLGSKKPQDLIGPKNSIKLQQEIVDRINQIIGEGKVMNIYYTTYLMQ